MILSSYLHLALDYGGLGLFLFASYAVLCFLELSFTWRGRLSSANEQMLRRGLPSPAQSD